MRRVRWKRKNVRDELAAGGQLTHTKERPVRTADKIQKSPASCADRCSLNNCILASAGMAFIWLQRGHHLLLFPLPLSILWGWFPKAGAEAPGLCVVGGPGRSRNALVLFFRGVGRVLFQKRMRPTSLRWELSLAGAGNYAKARGDAARFPVIRNHDGCPSKFQALRKGK